MLKYNEEIKVLREKVRDAENWEKKKSENAKKQYDHIKKLERELIENGVAIDEIEEYYLPNIASRRTTFTTTYTIGSRTPRPTRTRTQGSVGARPRSPLRNQSRK